jgi:hypothetical protein
MGRWCRILVEGATIVGMPDASRYTKLKLFMLDEVLKAAEGTVTPDGVKVVKGWVVLPPDLAKVAKGMDPSDVAEGLACNRGLARYATRDVVDERDQRQRSLLTQLEAVCEDPYLP